MKRLWNVDELHRNVDELYRDVDESCRNVDESYRNVDEYDENESNYYDHERNAFVVKKVLTKIPIVLQMSLRIEPWTIATTFLPEVSNAQTSSVIPLI